MSLLVALLRGLWLAWWDHLYERIAGPTVVVHDPPEARPRRSYRFRAEDTGERCG